MNKRKWSIRPDTIQRGKWSIGNCARSLNSTIRTSGMCTTKNPPWKMGWARFSGILRCCKRISWSQLDDQNKRYKIKKEKKEKKRNELPNSGFFFAWPQGKTGFALLVTHKEKRQSHMPGNLKKDWIRASRCSGRKFLSHLPPGSDRCGRLSSI